MFVVRTSMTNGKKVKDYTFDDKKERDDYGQWAKTGRETVTIRMPKAYHKKINSRVLEILLRNSLLEVYEIYFGYFLMDETPNELKFYEIIEHKFELDKKDMQGILEFFATDYWIDLIKDDYKGYITED